jgi:hypothetical protein
MTGTKNGITLKVRHESEESATAEAERLTVMNGGVKVNAYACAYTDNKVWDEESVHWHTGRAPTKWTATGLPVEVENG